MIKIKRILYFLIPVTILCAAFLFAGCSSLTDESTEYLNVCEEWYSIDKEAGTFKYLCVLENTSPDQIIKLETLKLTGINAEGDKIDKTIPAGQQLVYILPGQKTAVCIDDGKIDPIWSEAPEEIYCSVISEFVKETPDALMSITNVGPNGSGPYGTGFIINLKNEGEKTYNSDEYGGDYAEAYCEFIIVSRNSAGRVTDVCIGFPENSFTVDAGDESSFPLFGEIHGEGNFDIYLSCQH